ncbi:MAG: GNAT family N-acetyltransferase [Treponema sp.]|nr:GNAT family N-acetyltransferase [Candidatus Treponema equifaecale]
MILRKSNSSEAGELTRISIKAFGTDSLVGGAENDGPPGYDSEEWHMKMMEENHLFTYFDDDNTIIGGAVLFGKEELYVGRIFIDPKYFLRGYGKALMETIEKNFQAKTIKLDTPIWNGRTNQFYKKCGYIETGRDSENVYFEKVKE